MMRYPLCVGSWGRGLVNLFQYLAKEALVVVIVYMFYKHHLLPKRPEIIPTGDWLSTLLYTVHCILLKRLYHTYRHGGGANARARLNNSTKLSQSQI